MFAAVLALAFIVLAPTLGASLVGGINSHLPQQNTIVLDGNITPADTIYNGFVKNDTLTIGSANYTSDVSNINLYYDDVNGSYVHYLQTFTFTSDNKVFLILTPNPSDGLGTQSHASTPLFVFNFPVTSEMLKNADINTIKIFYNDGKSGNRTFSVYSSVSTQYITSSPFDASANGTWLTVNLSQLQLLSGAALHPNTLLIVQIDSDHALSSGDSVLMGLQLIGPAKGGMLHNWQNIYFGIAGLIALVAAIFATPYVNIRSFEKKKEDKVKGFKKSGYKRKDDHHKDDHKKSDYKHDHKRTDKKSYKKSYKRRR